MSILADDRATSTVVRLVRECIRFDVAVAWAGKNKVVDAMLTANQKIRHVVIGTHMYQTDPAVLRSFMAYKGARCVEPSGRLFHPKVYLFQLPNGFAMVVGSHNLTGGAFGGKNVEVSVLIEMSNKDDVFIELENFVKSSYRDAKVIKEDFLFAYDAQYRVNKANRSALNKFHPLKKPRDSAQTSPLEISWATFVTKVKDDRHHSLDGRLCILAKAAELFKEYESFGYMSSYERKAIAGTYGLKEPQLDDLPWGWFGTMVGLGSFTTLINNKPKRLSKALDNIPLDGDITEDHYNNFVRDFVIAFKDQARTGGVATASRLLAMKRPDVFVCVNDANRSGISDAFGSAPSTLSLDNYWERVITPMQSSPWWLHSRPRESLAGRIWDNRAALIDCIYYDPGK